MADEAQNPNTTEEAVPVDVTVQPPAEPAAPDASATPESEPTAPEVPAVDPNQPAGVPEGTVEKTDESVPEVKRERIDFEEKVVHETDADGNVVGWHKEAV